MKKNIITSLSLTALITTCSSLYPNPTSDHSINVVKNFGAFIIKIENTLDQFFDTNNKTPYGEYVTTLGNTMSDFENKLDHITRSPSDDLSGDLYDIACHGRQKFHAAYSVIKQYKGKSVDQIGRFVSDFNSVFSLEEAFSEIVQRLSKLHKKAKKNNHEELIATIEKLITLIHKMNNKWSSKNFGALLRGLKTRMSC